MDTQDFYCEECGAANTREAITCFACTRPLAISSAELPQRLSNKQTIAASQAPTSPTYLQITLSANAQTTVQLVQAQQTKPTLPLLHGRYHVLGQVGTGGFGAVYKARDTQAHDRMVAIKAIELDMLSTSQVIEATDTFNRELSLLSSLKHPHLPTIYEHFIDETHWYLVMDFIDGEPLDEYLQQLQEPGLPLKQVLNIGLQICDVLRYLHYLQPPVIFRDLKPANIMLTPGGRLYLIDFGIARRFKPGQARDTTPLGSPGFAAPEQYGKAQTTQRSDIYSLGVTLYFLLTGYDPANTPFNLPPIHSLCPTLPQPLVKLITSMLELDPAARPPSITSVQHILSDYAPSTHPTTALPQSLVSTTSANAAPQPAPPSSSFRFKNLLKGIFSVGLTCLIIAACTLTAHFLGAASFAHSSPPLFVNSGPIPASPMIFRMPYIGQLNSLNPFTTTDPQAAELENLLFGRLVSVDKNARVFQGIANSWDFSPDYLHWTFHINPNAIFSDGSPITASDVASSLNYALASPSAPTVCPLFSLIKDASFLQTHHHATLPATSIAILDSLTLTITITHPAPDFLAALSTPCGSIVKKSDLNHWGNSAFARNLSQIAFSSTYSVVTPLTDHALTLAYRISSNYVPPQFAQSPSEIAVQSYPDAAASYAAYASGLLDTSPAPGNVSVQDPAFSLAHPLTLHYYGMNYLAKPFDSPAMRQAFALALNKNILATNSQGDPTSSLLGSWQSVKNHTSTGSDPVKAKQLLAQGLQEEGLNSVAQLPPITFAYQAGQTALTSEIQLAQQMWKTVFGIEVTLQPVYDLNQAIAATRGNGKLQLWAADYTAPDLDPSAMVTLPFAQGSPLNAINYGQNTSVDSAQQQALQISLSSKALVSDSYQARLQIYQDADQKLVAEAAWLPIYMVSHAYFLNPEFLQPFSNQWSPWGSENYCAEIPPC